MKLQEPGPGKWQLFRIWASIGLQSFGGGATTTLLIQRAFIEKHRWLSIEEFMHLWNLCILTPGINLVALTVLIGRKLGGAWGIVVSLAGLLLPSATITCLITVGFSSILHLLASGVLIIAYALAVILLKLSVIVVVLGAAFLGALFFSSKSDVPLLQKEQGEQQ